jgi:hypothetical protein
MTPRSFPRLVSLACVALTATLVAGCGAVLDTDADEADDPVHPRSSRASQTPARTPSAPATSTSAAPDPSGPVAASSPGEDTVPEQPARSAGAPALSARLLTGEELPAVAGSGWEQTRTTGREPRSLAGTCHRFALLSIGATRVAHRDYVRADGSDAGRASELVASFADAKTAWRAYEVLRSWREDCGARLGSWDRHDVGPLRTLDSGPGQAHGYLLSYGPVAGAGRSSHFDAQGIALVGSRVAVLRIDHVGRDNPFAGDLEPVATAIRDAAAKLR